MEEFLLIPLQSSFEWLEMAWTFKVCLLSHSLSPSWTMKSGDSQGLWTFGAVPGVGDDLDLQGLSSQPFPVHFGRAGQDLGLEDPPDPVVSEDFGHLLLWPGEVDFMDGALRAGCPPGFVTSFVSRPGIGNGTVQR